MVICASARTEKVDCRQCLTHVEADKASAIGGGRVPLTGMQAVVKRKALFIHFDDRSATRRARSLTNHNTDSITDDTSNRDAFILHVPVSNIPSAGARTTCTGIEYSSTGIG